MREWPKDDKPADFEDIINPLVDSVKFAYRITRRNVDKDIPYQGYDIGRDCAHVALGAEALTADNLRDRDENQGRSALTEIISIAVQLGIEQGRRIRSENNSIKKLILSGTLAAHGVNESDINSTIDFIFS